MKKIYLMALTAIVLLMIGCSTTSTMTKSERKQIEEKEVVDRVMSKNYKIWIKREGLLNEHYWFEMKGDVVEARLNIYENPSSWKYRYFSQEWYGSDLSTYQNFLWQIRLDNEEISEYKTTVTTRGNFVITFKVLSPDSSYNVELEVYLNGRSYLTITPFNRPSIYYEGMMDLD